MSNNKFGWSSVTTGQMLGLMLIAYMFSFAVRMIWVFQFQDNPQFIWNNQLMINTNDGYFFAAGVQKELFGLHELNPRVLSIWDYGVMFFTVLFYKITPFSLETLILYMPSIVSSFVVVPIILIARLYKETLWGFLAALLGSIAWSYYNRTMVGYYDSDMFSAMAPMFILFFLMKSTIDFNLRSGLYAALAIAIYPFLYDAGLSIVYAMGMTYTAYMLFYHREEKITYYSLILVFISLIPIPLTSPWEYIVKVILLLIVYRVLLLDNLKTKQLIIVSSILFVSFLFFGNVLSLIVGKLSVYLSTGTNNNHGLNFYGVAQTVREAGKIPFSTMANRISGSSIGVIIALVGYIILVIRHRAFILALPLIGIGVFSLWGGLRFTVYAVPVAALSGIYLFFVIAEYIKQNIAKYIFVVVATIAMIYPNITHIIAYQVPTVLNNNEVQDLVKLHEISDAKDYTLTWWDYGYPIWYYSGTSTLIDGGKHHNDNFVISKILQTPSAQLAANLSRLAVETYVEENCSVVTNNIFKNGETDQVDPNLLLSELESNTYKLPKKSRDIYLYLPYRMLNIFPTVSVFGNLDLTTGKKERNIMFYPTSISKNKDGVLTFANGITFNSKNGTVNIGNQTVPLRYFIATEMTNSNDIKLQTQAYNQNAELVLIYMKSYGRVILMDSRTFNSTYIQMFILGKYNKELFELVVSSPYSRIYKLKK